MLTLKHPRQRAFFKQNLNCDFFIDSSKIGCIDYNATKEIGSFVEFIEKKGFQTSLT